MPDFFTSENMTLCSILLGFRKLVLEIPIFRSSQKLMLGLIPLRDGQHQSNTVYEWPQKINLFPAGGIIESQMRSNCVTTIVDVVYLRYVIVYLLMTLLV